MKDPDNFFIKKQSNKIDRPKTQSNMNNKDHLIQSFSDNMQAIIRGAVDNLVSFQGLQKITPYYCINMMKIYVGHNDIRKVSEKYESANNQLHTTSTIKKKLLELNFLPTIINS